MTRLQEFPDASEADTFERRWDAWQQRGRNRETRMRARFRLGFGALVLVAAAGVWLVLRG